MNFQTMSCAECGRAARTFVSRGWDPKKTFCSAFCRIRRTSRQKSQRANRVRKPREPRRKKQLSYLERKYGESFYTTREWQKLRYEVFKRDGRMCALCGACGHGVELHVDHIKSRSKYPELAMELDNLQVLCVECNLGKGAWDETDWRENLPQKTVGNESTNEATRA